LLAGDNLILAIGATPSRPNWPNWPMRSRAIFAGAASPGGLSLADRYQSLASGTTTPVNSDQSGEAAFKPCATPTSMLMLLLGL
jgi:hypothetical protein